jgi:uncharacterized RDD family membrane protein YckC
MSAAEQGASNARSGDKAGFWTRVGGAILDGVIVGVPGAALQIGLKGVGTLLSLLIGLLYFTILVGREKGQTIGMGAMGIRVQSKDGGGSIGYGRAAIRWIGGYISAVFLSIGYLWMIWDAEKQCWHDKMAGDVVVHVD